MAVFVLVLLFFSCAILGYFFLFFKFPSQLFDLRLLINKLATEALRVSQSWILFF